jgi:hypothetical protein
MLSRNYEPFKSHFWLDVFAAIIFCAALDATVLLIYWIVTRSPAAKN